MVMHIVQGYEPLSLPRVVAAKVDGQLMVKLGCELEVKLGVGGQVMVLREALHHLLKWTDNFRSSPA